MAEVYTWKGVPLNELSREDLEQALIEASTLLQDAQGLLLEESVERIRDLAAMARRR